jgi:hypothetical protein
MLIPTQLPSNSYFMLESACLRRSYGAFSVTSGGGRIHAIVVSDVSGKGRSRMNAGTLVGGFRNELHDPPPSSIT